MSSSLARPRRTVTLVVWITIVVVALVVDALVPGLVKLASGLTLLQLVALLAGVFALAEVLTLLTGWLLARRRKPVVEAVMVGRVYRLVAGVAVLMMIAYGVGKLASFSAFFAAFGGMLLGWSLQSPVSGFAASVLISAKRPFRPGDRIQFPNLGLTGDVHDVGLMYTMLNQVGGTVASEEAVGRYILVPNAMLFSQVVINYTVTQEAPYMLDEAIIRITYDSDWAKAEELLLQAAAEVTGDIIASTGVEPYIRSDLYDYGVYLRLRYQTRVKDRVEISYEITKRIFERFQQEDTVDFAIPYVYSYRAGLSRKDGELQDREARNIREIDLDQIRPPEQETDPADLEQLIASIRTQGLIQPVVLARNPADGLYDVLVGHLRVEACRTLGWKTIPALLRGAESSKPPETGVDRPRGTAAFSD